MPAIERALVVGGGPAGMVAAIALSKRGVDVEIVEINDDLRPLGSGLTMMSPTMRALYAADERAAEACVEQGAGHDRMIFGDAEGTVLQELELPKAAGPDLPAGFGIMRPVLWGLLAEAAQRAGAGVRLRTTVETIHQDDDGVDVSLSDGSNLRVDLLVGADGLHSRVRSLVFPDAPEPYYSGQTVWRAVVQRPDGTDHMGMYYSRRNKAGYSPVSHTHAYVFCVENALRRPRPPRAEWPGLIREQLSEFSGLIGWAREQMTDPDLIDCHPPQILLMPNPWVAGRVLIIGDAAHSTTPHLAMGAGMAIEDGVLLGEVIEGEPRLIRALEQFMERRYERARLVVRNSEQLGAWEQDPSVPASEHARLSEESFAALAAPI